MQNVLYSKNITVFHLRSSFINKRILAILFLLFFLNNYKAQEWHNNAEVGLLGNLGFLHFGYTRTVLQTPTFSFNGGMRIGIVPTSADETTTHPENSVPTFFHLNFPAELVWKFHPKNNITGGVSYSKILVATPDIGGRPKTNYNRFLGEVSYGFRIGLDEETQETYWIRATYSPIISDDHANDVENILLKLSFVYNF